MSLRRKTFTWLANQLAPFLNVPESQASAAPTPPPAPPGLEGLEGLDPQLVAAIRNRAASRAFGGQVGYAFSPLPVVGRASRFERLADSASRLAGGMTRAVLNEVRTVLVAPAPPPQHHDERRTIFVPFPETTIPLGAVRDIAVLPQVTFRCERIELAADVADHVVVDDIRIGSVSQFGSVGPIDGSSFVPRSNGFPHRLDVIMPGYTVLLRVRSKGTMPEMSAESPTPLTDGAGGQTRAILVRATLIGYAMPMPTLPIV